MERENPETRLPDVFELVTSIIDELSATSEAEATTTTIRIADRPNTRDEGGRNPLSSLPSDTQSKVKPLLLTLHCLFPNELLLALDILDKRLVKRCHICPTTRHETELRERGHYQEYYRAHKTRHDTYFVRSQSTLSSSSSSTVTPATAGGDQFYEVHLHSWNCTCAAFTLAMARRFDGHGSSRYERDDEQDSPEDVHASVTTLRSDAATSWRFGGTLTTNRSSRGSRRTRDEASSVASPSPTSTSPVCCKHLLACVLTARCPQLFGGGVEEVDFEFDENPSGPMYEIAAWHAGWAG